MEPKTGYSPNQIQRAVSKYFEKSLVSIFVVCPLRFENLLAQEMLDLGLKPEICLGGVAIKCSWGKMMLVNYSSRIATKVLLRIGEGYAKSYPELFDKLKRFPLHIYQGFEKQFKISVSCSESRLHHTGNISKTFEDALREKTKKDLSLGMAQNDDLEYLLRFEKDRFQLSLNVSGKPLYMRGYKSQGGKATLRENIASALLILTGAKEADFFLDAFCGSCTFLFEYFLLRKNIAPGWQRSFAFEKLPMFEKKPFDRIKANRDSEITDLPLKIMGSDISEKAVEISTSVAKTILEKENWVIQKCDFQDSLAVAPSFTKGCSVSNLPYGKRVKDRISHANLKLFDKKLKVLGLSRGYLLPEENDPLLHDVFAFKNGGIKVKYYHEK